MTWWGHFKLALHFPLPRTPIWATKSSGREGRVDMRPLSIDSSYDPTIGACCKGEASDEMDDPRGRGRGVWGMKPGKNWEAPDADLLGWWAW
jgi:hypothetical protein